MSSFVALMRRYVEEYTNAHDLTMVPQIISPTYRFVLGDETLDRESYVAMVARAFAAFPDLRLVAHRIVTSGDRLAMHFTETASSRRGGVATWNGVALYRRGADGLLAECVVQQDFHGRRRQLRSGTPAPAPGADPAVWGTRAMPPAPGAVEAFAAWATTVPGSLPGAAVDDGTPPVVAPATWSVVDAFAAGDTVAFAVRLRGRYRGGLDDVPDTAVGATVDVGATGLAEVREGRVELSRLVTDRDGLRRRLLGRA